MQGNKQAKRKKNERKRKAEQKKACWHRAEVIGMLKNAESKGRETMMCNYRFTTHGYSGKKEGK